MRLAQPLDVEVWSTTGTSPELRLSLWSAALTSALVPLTIGRADAKSFQSHMTRTKLGAVAIVHQSASPHSSYRARGEIARTTEHAFNLIMSADCSWNISHLGDSHMEPGDLILHDSLSPVALAIPHQNRFVNVQFTESWLRTWLPDPSQMIGRRIARHSRWGCVLLSYVQQLSPELLRRSSLPCSVLTDQIGSLLALVGAEMGRDDAPASAERRLGNRIQEVIRERCQEPALCAAEVAASLCISTRSLHRALKACEQTFGALLIGARVEVGLDMLRSPTFSRLTVAEIGRRSGFANPSHFSRALRMRTGLTPAQYRTQSPNRKRHL